MRKKKCVIVPKFFEKIRRWRQLYTFSLIGFFQFTKFIFLAAKHLVYSFLSVRFVKIRLWGIADETTINGFDDQTSENFYDTDQTAELSRKVEIQEQEKLKLVVAQLTPFAANRIFIRYVLKYRIYWTIYILPNKL